MVNFDLIHLLRNGANKWKEEKPSAVRVQTHSHRVWSKHSYFWGREGQEKGSPSAVLIGRVEHHAVCSLGQLQAAVARPWV